MVVWKGEIEPDHGEKAYNLDNTGLEVPNFFVITSQEVKQLFESRDPQEILNKSVELGELKEAYKDVGMSSEVRNASSKARSLVGGQRDKSKVSVRVSDNSEADYELDVGSSGLKDALRRVASSYFEEGGREYPNILVQKMIEPEYTGALIKGEQDYIEIVEGLGIALEEGKTAPIRYKIGQEGVVAEEIPDTQLKITKNPMTGDYRERRIRDLDTPFEESEIVKLSQKTNESVKFVYKRGSFFVVDRFEAEQYSDNFDYVRVSPGSLNGVIGRDIELSDDTVPPSQYENALVARKGGYTSTDAQKARKEGKPAVFSYQDVEEGQRFNESDEESVENNGDSVRDVGVSATEVKTISELERDFAPEEAYLTSYADVFAFNGDTAIIDGRVLDKDVLPSALEYVSGSITVLLEQPDREVLVEVVEQGFSVGVPENLVRDFESSLDGAEREFILEKLREL